MKDEVSRFERSPNLESPQVLSSAYKLPRKNGALEVRKVAPWAYFLKEKECRSGCIQSKGPAEMTRCRGVKRRKRYPLKDGGQRHIPAQMKI